MDSNFSQKVKDIISYSREEALRLGNDFIGTEHLLLGLLRDGEGVAINLLHQMQVDLNNLRRDLEHAIKDKNSKTVSQINSLPLTKQAEKVIRITVLEAKLQKSPSVESEHLMLSILKNKDKNVTYFFYIDNQSEYTMIFSHGNAESIFLAK
jgi:ATP-dependent Clp protease ATP-binding subunit ClpC